MVDKINEIKLNITISDFVFGAPVEIAIRKAKELGITEEEVLDRWFKQYKEGVLGMLKLYREAKE